MFALGKGVARCDGLGSKLGVAHGRGVPRCGAWGSKRCSSGAEAGRVRGDASSVTRPKRGAMVARPKAHGMPQRLCSRCRIVTKERRHWRGGWERGAEPPEGTESRGRDSSTPEARYMEPPPFTTTSTQGPPTFASQLPVHDLIPPRPPLPAHQAKNHAKKPQSSQKSRSKNNKK